jgi:protein-S-isoprenylcysteine O-methyltransferase Ste14
MVATMADRGETPGVRIEHPNREKASSKATKAVTVLLLLVSAALMAVVTIGGWERLEGAKAMQISYIVLYVVLAFFIARWKRGLLPVAAALAIVLLIFAAVSGPAWFDRDKSGFTDPTLDEDILGLLSLILVPVQILLIAFAMRGFQQAWNVEVERSSDERDERDERGGGEHRGRSAPAPA